MGAKGGRQLMWPKAHLLLLYNNESACRISFICGAYKNFPKLCMCLCPQ